MTLEHLKRLELLKTLIALEEKELLLSQVEKLEDEVPEKHVQEIAEAVRNIAYGDAVRRIDEILQESTSLHWKSKQINLILKKNKIDPFKICEIGCGSGGILINLEKELGNNKLFFGYEVSRHAFSICSKKKKDNIK